jgi:molecular chaperone DnaK (HSP70)
MSTEEIVPLVKERIPTIVGFDQKTQSNTIGDEARRTGLNGKTTVFNFKPSFGLGDKEFATTKKFWYWVAETSGHAQRTETFTAKEAAQRFLQTLFDGIQMPDKLIIGEPAIRDQTWKENFRRHMREVFSGLGLAEPSFFPEPFAVFQYYRHVDKTLPFANQAELVLIIDIGGGTFNSCIIRTTEQGLLARGGATSLPLGLQAEVRGGSEIDKELLKRVVVKCQASPIRWKEDPLSRAEFTASTALLRIEDAKDPTL